ncbi:uncharacterized protein LOC116174429 [Photinus pyralis]|uniref:uncharacterized protein LOC116174429 n=1 Tax=Photinus pyralis TaxID=7054 RepID=UPI0012672B57|nr:uncharacterized protein LOC116174429 [Photinus pyralis]
MMGGNHSVMKLLKNDIPNLFVMKCICHSFHLCASKACEKIPRFVEDLTRDVYNYFGSSPKRSAELKQFQMFCNVKMHKILHPSQTRWLSVHFVIVRILEQYGALQLFFTDAVNQNDVIAAENILQKLRDPTTKLFLQFLEFVLPYFNNLNREMQSENPKLHLLYKNITTILRTLFDCFIKNPVVVKSGSLASINDILMLFPNIVNPEDLQRIDSEWRLLRNTEEISNFSNDVMTFWLEVQTLKRGDDTLVFKNLVNFVFQMLTLPHSSANVERVFSLIHILKTKQRNKLSTETISGLLLTKALIGRDECYSFNIDGKLISGMTNSNLYQ